MKLTGPSNSQAAKQAQVVKAAVRELASLLTNCNSAAANALSRGFDDSSSYHHMGN